MRTAARAGSRGRWRAVAIIIGFSLTASACSAASGILPPTASSSAPDPNAPSSPQPTASPAPEIPTGQVKRDRGATLAVAPVDYGGVTAVTARFTTKAVDRPASLQRSVGGDWVEVATGELDRTGAVDFLPPYAKGATYRAVAGEFSSAGKVLTPVTTAAFSAEAAWRSVLSSGFNGDSLEGPWDYSITGSYKAGGRQCSAPYPSNVAFADGKVVLSVTKETNARNIRRAKAAGCKHNQFNRNALLSTGSKFTIRAGTVAARLKFAQGQGMHGSVFMLSPTLRSEIDMIESYGYGRGTTSVAHLNGKRYPTEDDAVFVNTEAVKDRAWWNEYHVFSAQWTRNELILRIDGVESTRLRGAFADTYSIYISMLSSDWELVRLKNPTKNAEGVTPTPLPQAMTVDWVKAWEPRG